MGQERLRNEDRREERARMTLEERGRLRRRLEEELRAGEERREERTRRRGGHGAGGGGYVGRGAPPERGSTRGTRKSGAGGEGTAVATAGVWEEELHAGEERQEEHTLMTLEDDVAPGRSARLTRGGTADGAAALAADHLASLVGGSTAVAGRTTCACC